MSTFSATSIHYVVHSSIERVHSSINEVQYTPNGTTDQNNNNNDVCSPIKFSYSHSLQPKKLLPRILKTFENCIQTKIQIKIIDIIINKIKT